MKDTIATGNQPGKKARPAFCLMVFILSILAAGGAFAQGSSSGEKSGKSKATSRTASGGAVLSLDSFLNQVGEKHTGYKAAESNARGAKLYSEESSLIFKPSLTGNATSTTLGQGNPFASSDKLHITNYNLGVSQQTTFGLTGKLTYNRAEYDFPAGGGQTSSSINSDWFQLEVSQSIWRNWAGRESRAQRDYSQSTALTTSISQSYLTKQILLESESAYWNLALARERVAVQKDSVERAQRIQDWTSRRVRLQLADRADGIQAAAQLQNAKLTLRRAEDEERAAAQAFNSARGIDANVVDEQLVPLSSDLISRMSAPARTQKRDDVRIAEMQSKAASANAQLAQERNKPTVELFASVPVTEPTGAPSSANPATSSVLLQGSTPATTIGLRLVAPLDFATLKRTREGYAAAATAAEYNFQRKVFEEERDWSDLTAKFQQAKERLALYTELEKTQKEALNYERDRQQRGRSTLANVLKYETDYEAVQIGRIATLAEVLGLNAQMKLYGVSYESR